MYGFARFEFESTTILMPFSTKNLCGDYFGSSVFNTNILNMHEEYMLDVSIQHHVGNDIHPDQKEYHDYQLLFRGTEHEFSAARYHEYCDRKSNTITSIYNEYGHVFGGYFAMKLDNPADGSRKKGIHLPKIYYSVER